MKTTRREFLATAAGFAGTLALGSIGLSREAGAAETGPLRHLLRVIEAVL